MTSRPAVKFDVIVARADFQEMVLLVLLALETVAESFFGSSVVSAHVQYRANGIDNRQLKTRQL